MFVIRCNETCGVGDTLDEAIFDFQDMTGYTFNPEEHFIYEGKEVHVECKYTVVKGEKIQMKQNADGTMFDELIRKLQSSLNALEKSKSIADSLVVQYNLQDIENKVLDLIVEYVVIEPL